MVFYFSGTGNSQLAAKQIAETLGDETVSINQCLKAGTAGPFYSERPLVFVTPTYAWRIPRLVDRWIRQAHFIGSTSVWFVLTCGDGCGNAERYARRLCIQKGLRLRGLASVVMPENYLIMFPTPDSAKAQAILARARPRIAALTALIQGDRPFPKQAVSPIGKIESALVNPLFALLFIRDKGFWVSDACTSCGKCARRCPTNNIVLSRGRPVWNGRCTHCMGCIGGCPAQAIEYKNKSLDRPRYDRMEE